MTGGSRRWRQAGALLAALALLLAPLQAAFAAECGLCPPDCPMHAEHAAREGRGPVMKCHGGAARDTDHAQAKAPQWRRPACDAHGALPGLTLAPVILPAASPAIILPARAGLPPAVPGALSRSADPPDTPPPDRRA